MEKLTRMIALTSGLMALTVSAVLADEMGGKAANGVQPSETPVASKPVANPSTGSGQVPKSKAKVANPSSASGQGQSKKKIGKKVVKEKYVWVCPMGDYTGDKPGKCPNCQMDLVKQKVTESKPAAEKSDKKM